MRPAAARALRVLLGMWCVSYAFAMTVKAHLGLGPWHVLQEGFSRTFGLDIGLCGFIAPAALFVVALLLKERPGFGTLVSVGLGGAFLDLALPITPEPHALVWRALLLAGGAVLMPFGGALYLSAQMGAAPLDAVMTGIYRRVRTSLYGVRIGLELTGFLLGWAFGGEIGVGCLVIGLGIGPGIQLWLRVLRAMPEKLPGVLIPEEAHQPVLAGLADS